MEVKYLGSFVADDAQVGELACYSGYIWECVKDSKNAMMWKLKESLVSVSIHKSNFI